MNRYDRKDDKFVHTSPCRSVWYRVYHSRRRGWVIIEEVDAKGNPKGPIMSLPSKWFRKGVLEKRGFSHRPGKAKKMGMDEAQLLALSTLRDLLSGPRH